MHTGTANVAVGVAAATSSTCRVERLRTCGQHHSLVNRIILSCCAVPQEIEPGSPVKPQVQAGRQGLRRSARRSALSSVRSDSAAACLLRPCALAEQRPHL